MKRRDFVFGSCGIAMTWPLSGRAQQAAMPVIGFLRNTTAASSVSLVAAFRRGLAEAGFIEGQNVMIEYRWAGNHDDRLPVLAADLVARNVAVIVSGGGSIAALAAKAATATIPVVFELGGDPVKLGLVPNLNRPGGNVTGIALFANTIGPKRVELLLNLVPKAGTIGVLTNSASPNAASEVAQAEEASRALGVKVHILRARTDGEIDAAFASLSASGVGALVVTASPLFVGRRDQMIGLAARYRMPTIYPFRDFADAGGLMSYGDSLTEAFRHTGNYAGRILKGESVGDLPVVQPAKFEFVINLKTAKTLKLDVSAKMLALADEAIE